MRLSPNPGRRNSMGHGRELTRKVLAEAAVRAARVAGRWRRTMEANTSGRR